MASPAAQTPWSRLEDRATLGRGNGRHLPRHDGWGVGRKDLGIEPGAVKRTKQKPHWIYIYIYSPLLKVWLAEKQLTRKTWDVFEIILVDLEFLFWS